MVITSAQCRGCPPRCSMMATRSSYHSRSSSVKTSQTERVRSGGLSTE